VYKETITKKLEIMNATATQIKYENGNIFNIYTKLTKSGVRYYRYSSRQMRYFPISQLEINKYILLD
jgi:hypothetical protein